MSTKSERRPLLVPLVVSAVAIALIVLVVALRSGADEEEPATGPDGGTTSQAAPGADQGPTAVENPEGPDLSAVEGRDPDDPLAAGPVDAPVVLVVFSDYQCPFCATWNTDTLPELMPHVEAGELRIEWRDVNVFGDDSERASQAAYAAALQGEFRAYHDALFAGGEPRSAGGLSRDALVDLAGELGLDVEQFTADLGAAQTAAAVDENAQLGYSLGVYSTPAFLLGGEPILGAQPTEVFLTAFDQALAGAG